MAGIDFETVYWRWMRGATIVALRGVNVRPLTTAPSLPLARLVVSLVYAMDKHYDLSADYLQSALNADPTLYEHQLVLGLLRITGDVSVDEFRKDTREKRLFRLQRYRARSHKWPREVRGVCTQR